jgi:DnaJ-domain-containing protein 1
MSDACPFAILGLAPSWPVDAATVHRARLGAAARFHPDRARDAVERAAFEARMGSANQAAEHLLDPVMAAGAMLRAAGADPTELPLPPMELMELLERREWFEGCIASSPAAQAEAHAWAASERASLIAGFGTAMAAGHATGAWTEARRIVARLRALARMTDADSVRRG